MAPGRRSIDTDAVRLVSTLRPPRGLVLCLLAAILAGGCQRPLRADRRPYRLSLGLLEPQGALRRQPRVRSRSKQKTRPRRKRVALDRRCRAIVARAKALVGQRLPGTSPQRQRALLTRALGSRQPRWRVSRLRRRARPGDLIVFDQTRDENGNRRLDDRRSDVGIVLARRGSRVTFVYVSGERVRQGVLDLRRRSQRRRRGRLLNSYVRIKTPNDSPRTRYLAGELLAGFLPPT